MKIVPVAEVKAHFSAYLEACRTDPVVVTRNGRPAAMLVYIQDEDELERLMLAHNPRFRRLLDEAEARIRRTGGIKHDDLWKLIERENGGEVKRAPTSKAKRRRVVPSK